MAPPPRGSSAQQPWLKRVWRAHFVAGIIVAAAGIWHNQRSRKYVLINPSTVGPKCQRAFVNVMAPSPDDPEAIVCCFPPLSSDYQDGSTSGICPWTETYKLPFAGRLAKFPEAWLLPLFPLFLRIIYVFRRKFKRRGLLDRNIWTMAAIGRLCFYAVLMSIRGWVLYVGLNYLEDQIMAPIPETCWYRDWLQEDQDACYGRVFDFSDHMVLYFGQILPIPLTEVLYSLETPYWSRPGQYHSPHSIDGYALRRIHWQPLCLIGGLLYLYLISLLGIFTTASYFHTAPEVFVGLVLSLWIYIPLWCIQCTNQCRRARQFLYPRHSSHNGSVNNHKPVR